MVRVFRAFLLLTGVCALSAYPLPWRLPIAFNTTIERQTYDLPAVVIASMATEKVSMPTAAPFRVLLLQYSAYDSAYAQKIEQFVRRGRPEAKIKSFWQGSKAQLQAALTGQHVVVISYPSKGVAHQLQQYGQALEQFVQQGGNVIFTGTHKFGILQQYGLLDLDFGYYATGVSVHGQQPEHTLWAGLGADFLPTHYTYPLDISDPNFVSLADASGYPVVGFKPLGLGKVIYLGLEYYFDDAASIQLLVNALQWVTPTEAVPETTSTASSPASPVHGFTPTRRTEEVLLSGSGRTQPFKWNVFPNPYVEKASLELDVQKPTTVSIEVTNEQGQWVTTVWPRRQMMAGTYRFEVPSLPQGIYFVKCTLGEDSQIKKIVKVQG